MGVVPGLRRNVQQGHHRLQQQEYSHVEDHRHRADEEKGEEEAALQLLLSPGSVEHGPQGPAAHAQPQQHRGEEGHQGEGKAHRGQSLSPQGAAYNEGVCNVVALLQQVAGDHGGGKTQHGAGDPAPGQVDLHGKSSSLSRA